MSTGAAQDNRRILGRGRDINAQFPASCVLRFGNELKVTAKAINFHFRGACLEVSAQEILLIENFEGGPLQLDFYLGEKLIQEALTFRLCWTDSQRALLGVEFLKSIQSWIEREARFPTHHKVRPSVATQDPLEAGRLLYFNVQNVSSTGMLLSTSLANKHLFPGMELKKSQLTIPGSDPVVVDLMIENTRAAESQDELYVGVSIRSSPEVYVEALKSYLSSLSPLGNEDKGFSEFSRSKLFTRKLKQNLTFREVHTNEDYEKVLRLRFAGYGKHGKVPAGTTWEKMGEGLQQEGLIVAAFLGSRMVASMEFRFGNSPKGFRYFNPSYLGSNEKTADRYMEINKLVIDPDAQGTDIFLGMLQKIHSTVIARGELDAVMAATEKLAPLYERAGAQRTGQKIPHPTLANEFLNILVVTKDIYSGEDKLNPFAWSQIYGAVNEVYTNYGLTSRPTNTLQRRLHLQVTKLIFPYFEKYKKKRKRVRPKSSHSDTPVAQPRKETRPASRFIDPKWTRQDLLATVLLPYILEADRLIGTDKVNEILGQLGLPRDYLTKQSNWVSVAFMDAFLDLYGTHKSVAELSRAAGLRSLKPDVIGMNYFFLKHFVSPEKFANFFAKIMPKFNRSREYALISQIPGRIVVAVRPREGYALPKHSESCLNWTTNLESYIQVLTQRPGTVSHPKCCYHGDAECVFEARWTPRSSWLNSDLFIAGFLGILSMSLSQSVHDSLKTDLPTTLAVGTLMSLSSLCLLQRRRLRKEQLEREQLNSEFEGYQQDSTERYEELQKTKAVSDQRYQESILLDNTSRMIQQNDDVSKILQASLEAACRMLGFSRAFVMLVNPEKTKLETASVFGVPDGFEPIWKFSVDVSVKRDGSFLLSSVYRSGQPIMIDDIEKHKFQLNDSSRRLIENLRTQGFLMVPIPSNPQNWGVIIADKSGRAAGLTRRDLVLLQRVSQSMGMALDKQAKFNQEAQLRRLFQRYVPAAILDEVSVNRGPALGGRLQEIACLFLDIRDFTATSQALTPQMTIELLNRVFSKVQEIVSRHRGIIDKFLGDGVLVTWGTLRGTAPDPQDALRAVFEIRNELPQLNEELRNAGLPPVRVGMGLHSGPAVVGNIGSNERMEFTSIGTTVNVASRLESLNKKYDSNLVVSSTILDMMDLNQRRMFQVVEQEIIRGLEGPTRIAYILNQNIGAKDAA